MVLLIYLLIHNDLKVVQHGEWLKIRSLCDQKPKAYNDLYYKYTLRMYCESIFVF